MDILLIILAVVAAYLLFITFTYWLARWFFPSIDVDDDELDDLADLKLGMKKIKDKFQYSRAERHARRYYTVKR